MNDMRKATRIVSSTFGFLAGIAGLGHGVTEVLQGNVHPTSVMFASIGAPCVPEKAWHACEPAMTLLPNLLIAGILTVIFGLLILIWSAAFVQRKKGGSLLILFSVILLLVGGGIFPPLIGIVGGIAGTRINKPLAGRPAGNLLSFVAKLWPWTLILFVGWILGQYLVGFFLNDILRGVMGFGLLFILLLLPLSVYTGFAEDTAG